MFLATAAFFFFLCALRRYRRQNAMATCSNRSKLTVNLEADELATEAVRLSPVWNRRRTGFQHSYRRLV